MRITAALIICLVTGLAFLTYFLIDNQTLNPDEMVTVRSVCAECHGGVPVYSNAMRVHNLHVALDCVRCHNYIEPSAHLSAITKESDSSQLPSAKPTNIPHEIENRVNCLGCHGTGVGGISNIPNDHTGRTNETCRLCHTTSE